MNKEREISPRQIAKAIEDLLDERDDLQQRIDKAISVIDGYKDKDYSRYYENEIEMDLIDDIKEILGAMIK